MQNQPYTETEESYDDEEDSSDTSSENSDDGEEMSEESSLTDYHPSEKVRTYFNSQADMQHYYNHLHPQQQQYY